MLDREPSYEIEKPNPPSSEKGVVVFPKSSINFRVPGLTWSVRNSFNGGHRRRGRSYQLTLWSWMASFIDALIILGLNCLFVMLLAKLGKIPVQRSLFVQTFLWCSWIYMISLRGIYGSSIGEMACELRLGLPNEHLKPQYLFKVLVRSTAIVLTGVVTVPLLSIILDYDILGKFSGLRLYSLK